MIRRLLMEHAYQHRRRYIMAFAMMAGAAACTAFCAYLLGTVINQAYVHKDFRTLILISIGAFGIFVAQGHADLRPPGHDDAGRQSHHRRKSAPHVRQAAAARTSAYFADRHSSEFIARLMTGAAAANFVLCLLITSFGRDLLTLIGLYAVMVIQDPVMSLVGLIVAPPALIALRKLIRRVRAIMKVHFTGGTRIIETLQETLQGMRVVKAFTLEDEMRRRIDGSVTDVQHEADKWARVSNRSGPIMETLGGLAIGALDRLQQLSGDLPRRRARRLHVVPRGVPARLRAGQAALAPQPRARQSSGRRAHAVRGAGQPGDRAERRRTSQRSQLATARVEFADVRFAYRADDPVLRGMSFVAEPGKVTALVGPSGGGKSTVFNLLLRFYETESGAISDRRAGDPRRFRAARCAARSAMWGRTCTCSAARSATTSATAGSTRAKPRSSPPRRPRMRTISSWASRRATTRRSASTGTSSPAASASASRSRAR